MGEIPHGSDLRKYASDLKQLIWNEYTIISELWETCYFSSFTRETSFFFFSQTYPCNFFFLQFFGVVLWKISWNCQESATFNNINSERERKARRDHGGQKCWLPPMAMLVSSCDSSQVDNTPLEPPGAESLWFCVQLKRVARRRRA